MGGEEGGEEGEGEGDVVGSWCFKALISINVKFKTLSRKITMR